MKKGHIISIGNELLIGDTVNTNAAWLGRYLTEKGFECEQVFTLPDSYELICSRIEASLKEAEITIVTGGLGPTHDDITKKAVADIFNVQMIENRQVLDHIKKIFKKRGFTFSRSNAEQALVPENCEVMFNSKGTAPGMLFEQNGHLLAVLPGVPYEMSWICEHELDEQIEKWFPGNEFRAVHYFKTAGVPESTLSDDVVGDLSSYLGNGVQIAYLPSTAGVTIRTSAEGATLQQAEKKLEQFRDHLYKAAGDVIYGEGKDANLADVTGQLLAEKGLTIAAAESCTGGLLLNSLTDISGSSRYVVGGVVAYANSVKMNTLGVSKETLERAGAVSRETALQMAAGAAKHFGADIGVSTTGVAGPGGGTKEKPVGLVWMGFKINDHHFALKAQFSNDRLINKERAVMVVLETIRRHLLGLNSYPYHLKPETP